MRVILQTWCQIQRTSSSIRYVNCGPGHIQCNYSSAYSGSNIELNVSPLLLEISRQINARYTAKIAHNRQSTTCELWPRHIQCIYSSTYSCFNIRLNVSSLLLEISRQCNARYTASLVSNTAHTLRFTLCELWSRPYTMYLQLFIFRLQYSAEGTCTAIGGISTIQ
jgi:hypothetical protein